MKKKQPIEELLYMDTCTWWYRPTAGTQLPCIGTLYGPGQLQTPGPTKHQCVNHSMFWTRVMRGRRPTPPRLYYTTYRIWPFLPMWDLISSTSSNQSFHFERNVSLLGENQILKWKDLWEKTRKHDEISVAVSFRPVAIQKQTVCRWSTSRSKDCCRHSKKTILHISAALPISIEKKCMASLIQNVISTNSQNIRPIASSLACLGICNFVFMNCILVSGLFSQWCAFYVDS